MQNKGGLEKIVIYTIGFTKKTAREFFQLLKKVGITKVIDIRLNNTSQLSGFAKREDLEFFLEECFGIKYEYMRELAPTPQILKNYKKNKNWDYYVKEYNSVMKEKVTMEILKKITDEKEKVCLLCSEDKPDKCHRRLLVEYISNFIPDIKIVHL